MLPNVVGGWLADQTGPTWAIDPVFEVTPIPHLSAVATRLQTRTLSCPPKAPGHRPEALGITVPTGCGVCNRVPTSIQGGRAGWGRDPVG